MKYEKTDDPNIIKKIQTMEGFIHLDELETEIKNLESQINDRPKPKTKPDQETLDCYNMEIEMQDPMLEEELKEKKELLNTLKSL